MAYCRRIAPNIASAPKKRLAMPVRFAIFPLLLGGLLAAVSPALAQGGYHVLNTYTLGGDGGWDYLNLDPVSGKLFITRGSHVMVVDPVSGKLLVDITGLQGIHGTAFVGAKAYVSEGGANRV